MEELGLRASIFPIKYGLRLFAGGGDRPMIALCDRVSAGRRFTPARQIWNMEYIIGDGKRPGRALSVAHTAWRAKRVPRYPSSQRASLDNHSNPTGLTDSPPVHSLVFRYALCSQFLLGPSLVAHCSYAEMQGIRVRQFC